MENCDIIVCAHIFPVHQYSITAYINYPSFQLLTFTYKCKRKSRLFLKKVLFLFFYSITYTAQYILEIR